MSIEMVLYLVELIGSVACFLTVFSILGILLTILLILLRVAAYGSWKDREQYLGTDLFDKKDEVLCKSLKEAHESLVKWSKISIFSTVIILVASTLIPSQKTLYMMLAANVAQKSEIPEKVLKAIELKLDEYIEEVKDKVKK